MVHQKANWLFDVAAVYGWNGLVDHENPKIALSAALITAEYKVLVEKQRLLGGSVSIDMLAIPFALVYSKGWTVIGALVFFVDVLAYFNYSTIREEKFLYT